MEVTEPGAKNSSVEEFREMSSVPDDRSMYLRGRES